MESKVYVVCTHFDKTGWNRFSYLRLYKKFVFSSKIEFSVFVLDPLGNERN